MNRSSNCEDGGTDPHWNDTFYCSVQNDPMLRVEVWDNDTCDDDIVGQGQYNLAQVLAQRMDTTVWVDLFHNGECVGKLALGVSFQHGYNPNMGMGCNYNMNMGGNCNMGGNYNPHNVGW